MKADYFIPA